MHTLTSKLGIKRIIFWVIYFYTITAGVYLGLISLIKVNSSEFPFYVFSLMALGLIGAGIYGFWWDYKNIPKLEIDNDKMVIARLGTFFWNDLLSCNTEAKKQVGRNTYEVIKLQFREGTTILLYKFGYRNSKEISEFISSILSQNSKQ